jgi:hypothetical protein
VAIFLNPSVLDLFVSDFAFFLPQSALPSAHWHIFASALFLKQDLDDLKTQ